jgi:hypothetical protein
MLEPFHGSLFDPVLSIPRTVDGAQPSQAAQNNDVTQG